MKVWRLAKVLLTGLLAGVASAVAALAPPQAFRTVDGAYVTEVGGDLTDPYFVNKAFIIALEADAALREEVVGWLAWLLPRQRRDGGFDRFCGARSGHWVACLEADADDSMAATTIHLIELVRRKGWLDPAQDARARRAGRRAAALLRTLRDPGDGLYHAFAHAPAQYLMDNLEVHAALRISGQRAAADALLQAIRRHFHTAAGWRPSRPDLPTEAFYPHALARTFLWRSGIMGPAEAAADEAAWLAQYSRTWLGRDSDPYAWGLVAWDIHELAPLEAACWRASVRIDPAAVGWTVLDAQVDAALRQRGIPAACPRLNLQGQVPAPG